MVGRRIKCQLQRANRVEARGRPDDHQREDEPHAEYRDKNPDRQEHALPKHAHLLQNRGVDDGVVERQGHFEDREHHEQEQGGEPAVCIPGNQGRRGHSQRNAEDA